MNRVIFKAKLARKEGNFLSVHDLAVLVLPCQSSAIFRMRKNKLTGEL